MNARTGVLLCVLVLVCAYAAFVDYSLSTPPPEKSSRPAAGPKDIDLGAGPYRFVWEARRGERPAERLEMQIEPTDQYGWWWKGGIGNPRRLRDTGAGPETLVLDLLVPSIDSIPISGLSPLCRESIAPFLDCRIARARLVVDRDDGWWDYQAILRGIKPPAKSYASTQRTSLEFWVRDSLGKLHFLGWECGNASWHGASDLLGGEPEPNTPLAEKLRCYRPDMRSPAFKQRLLIECKYKTCEMRFLFRGRTALVDAEHLMLDAPRMRGLMLLAAWNVLNRMHANGKIAPSAQNILAEGHVQQEVCRSLGNEAAEWKSRRKLWKEQENGVVPNPYASDPESEQRTQERWNNMSLGCQRAVDIALRMSASAPRDAEQILHDVLETYAVATGISSTHDPLYRAWFAAVEAQGKGNGPSMVTALTHYLRHSSTPNVGSAEWKERQAMVRRLQKLGDLNKKSLSPQQLEDIHSPALRIYLEYESDSVPEEASSRPTPS